MNPYARGAQFVIRLTAGGLIMWSVIEIGFYAFATILHRKYSGGFWSWFIMVVPLLTGLILMVKSRSLARKLTEDFDD
ncbi:MAG: hypothetical protein H7X97_02680 [Opitutaceae bacterium]|nr:hypothetical protein [Verrucomicrobiales bacterium]